MATNYAVFRAGIEDLRRINLERNEFFMSAPEFLPHGVEGSMAWVAKEGEKIIGFIEIDFGGDELGKNAEIRAFSMRKGYDKKGIGSKLFAQAEDFAKKNGAKNLRVWGNLDALSYYRRRGFRGSPLDMIKTLSRKNRPRAGLAPQNVLRPERRLKRAARK